jgi:transcriptional regulator with PAS, ATPase and Fis domain
MDLLRAALPSLRNAFESARSLAELLQAVREAFRNAVPCEDAQGFLRDGGAGGGFLVLDAQGTRRIAGVGGLIEDALALRVPVLVSEEVADPRLLFHGDQSVRSGVRNALAVPLLGRHKATVGAIELVNGAFTDEDVERAVFVAELAAIAVEQFQGMDFLRNLNLALQAQTGAGSGTAEYLLESKNPQLIYVRERLRSYAEAEASVLVEGESGTGKEGITRLLHDLGKRANGPFVVVNCSAIPETLFEAELFGAAKGAATGVSARKGKIELAHKGTLVLDEIGELPLSLQPKLLRALQEKRITPLGSDLEPKEIDFRLVCSTNRNLAEMVRKGQFREDLFFRINVITINLPPLRERREDIPAIARAILAELCRQYRLSPKSLAPRAVEALQARDWPGNVRELRNQLEGALIVQRDRDEIGVGAFQERTPATPARRASRAAAPLSLREAKARAEREAIDAALAYCSGNKAAAARALGLTREGLRKAMLKRL